VAGSTGGEPDRELREALLAGEEDFGPVEASDLARAARPWQAWDACYRACQLLVDGDPAVAEKGLRALASFHEYGVLSEEHVKEALAQVRQSPAAQTEHFQAELALVKASFEHAMEDLRQKLGAVRKEAGWLEKLIGALEGFLDAGDAVRRRRLANQIYRDLVVERISTDRAVLELQNPATSARRAAGCSRPCSRQGASPPGWRRWSSRAPARGEPRPARLLGASTPPLL
jgi:hypothetical protein